MKKPLVFAACVLWLVSGYSGYAYWLTTKYDFGVGDALLGIFVSLSGPFSWVNGCFIMGPCKLPDEVLIHKRASQ